MATLPVTELTHALDNIQDSLATPLNASLKALAQDTSSTPSPIKVSDFTVGSVAYLESDKEEVSYNDLFTIKINFGNENTRFNLIKTIKENYSIDNNYTDILLLVNENPPFFTFKNIYNPGDNVGNTFIDHEVSIKFKDDSFNQDAQNYDSFIKKKIKLYTPLKPVLTILSSTRPPRPCCGIVYGSDGLCCGATITVKWSLATFQGSNYQTATLEIFNNNGNPLSPRQAVNLNIQDDNLNGTHTFGTGYPTGPLQGSTTYKIRLTIDGYGTYDEKIQTTPAYV